MQLLCLFDEAK